MNKKLITIAVLCFLAAILTCAFILWPDGSETEQLSTMPSAEQVTENAVPGQPSIPMQTVSPEMPHKGPDVVPVQQVELPSHAIQTTEPAIKSGVDGQCSAESDCQFGLHCVEGICRGWAEFQRCEQPSDCSGGNCCQFAWTHCMTASACAERGGTPIKWLSWMDPEPDTQSSSVMSPDSVAPLPIPIANPAPVVIAPSDWDPNAPPQEGTFARINQEFWTQMQESAKYGTYFRDVLRGTCLVFDSLRNSKIASGDTAMSGLSPDSLSNQHFPADYGGIAWTLQQGWRYEQSDLQYYLNLYSACEAMKRLLVAENGSIEDIARPVPALVVPSGAEDYMSIDSTSFVVTSADIIEAWQRVMDHIHRYYEPQSPGASVIIVLDGVYTRMHLAVPYPGDLFPTEYRIIDESLAGFVRVESRYRSAGFNSGTSNPFGKETFYRHFLDCTDADSGPPVISGVWSDFFRLRQEYCPQ